MSMVYSGHDLPQLKDDGRLMMRAMYLSVDTSDADRLQQCARPKCKAGAVNLLRRVNLVFLSVLLSILAAACATPVRPVASGPADAAVPGASEEPGVVVSSDHYVKEYVLAPMDSIDVSVMKHPEVTRVCVIRPDGCISLPMVNDVKAAGLTPEQLRQALTEQMAARIKDPEVAVVVTDFRPPRVFVMGDVQLPKAVPLRDASTPAQAIANAGGFTAKAKKRSVLVIRVDDDHHLVTLPIEVSSWGRGQTYVALNSVPLKPDDIIFVPTKYISKVSSFINENVTPILTAFNSAYSIPTNFKVRRLLDADIKILERSSTQSQSQAVSVSP